jgi:hypothetical protein
MNRARKVILQTAQTNFCEKETSLPSPLAARTEDKGEGYIGTGLDRCT